MTYFIAGIFLVLFHFIHKALKRPLMVSTVKTSTGGERVFLLASEKENKTTLPIDSHLELHSADTRYIHQMKELDIEAPDGMMFLAPNSSEFMNSSFSLSNFTEVHVGGSFNGLKVLKIKGNMASISYKGFIRLIDLSKSPIIAVDGVIIRIYPFSPDGDKFTAISIEGLMFHSKVLRSSFGLKMIDPKTALEDFPFSKVDLMEMVKV